MTGYTLYSRARVQPPRGRRSCHLFIFFHAFCICKPRVYSSDSAVARCCLIKLPESSLAYFARASRRRNRESQRASSQRENSRLKSHIRKPYSFFLFLPRPRNCFDRILWFFGKTIKELRRLSFRVFNKTGKNRLKRFQMKTIQN